MSATKKPMWTPPRTHDLISVYKKVQNGENAGARFWTFVEKEMEKIDFHVSDIECRKRWRKLKVKYSNIKSQTVITWPYYKEMDEIFRDKQISNNGHKGQKKITDYFQAQKK